MVIGKSIYPGEAYDTTDEDLEDDEIQRLTTAHAEIQSLYLAGTPVFTREAIRDISQQLVSLKGKCGKVSVRGLDGIPVEFAVETGRMLPGPPGSEFVLEAPFIHYSSIQELTSMNHFSIPRLAFCSLRIYHYMSVRNKLTNGHLDAVPAKPLEDTREMFTPNQQQWEESEQCKQLISILKSTELAARTRQIVAFACGSIGHDFEAASPRSSFQHALILTLRDLFCREENHGSISCYAQDPEYTEVDVSILEERGITVVDDPEAFLKVDDSSFVISCGPQVPVRQITLDLARPAAMIWNRAKERDANILWADPYSSRIGDIISKSYDVFEFPGSEENFGDVVLYVRRAVHEATA